ncbi:hypothetical protein Tco_1314904 [Tanacetum coccineum]
MSPGIIDIIFAIVKILSTKRQTGSFPGDMSPGIVAQDSTLPPQITPPQIIRAPPSPPPPPPLPHNPPPPAPRPSDTQIVIRGVPLYYPSWLKVPKERKAALITDIGTQFDLRPHMKSPDWTEFDAGIQQHLQKAYNTNKAAFKA